MYSLDDVYRKFGEVSEAAQLLETELGNILLEIRATEEGLFFEERPEEAAEILVRINKSTLGSVLKQIYSSTETLDHAAELFASALAERNRLAHSFYRQHNFRRNSDDGRALMIEDLESIHRTFLDTYKVALAVSGFDLGAIVTSLPTKHRKI